MFQFIRTGCENFSVGLGRTLAVIILLFISSSSLKVFVKKECKVLYHITTTIALKLRGIALDERLNNTLGKVNSLSAGVDIEFSELFIRFTRSCTFK